MISNIGDSISTGYDVATPWPSLLSSLLNTNIHNNAKSGELTTYGLSIIKEVINQSKPAIMTIMLGTNDSEKGTPSQALANLQSMIDIANSHDIKVYVATLPPITNNVSNEKNAHLISEGIKQLKKAAIVDVRAAMGSGDGLLDDGVHPNTKGQQVIAETFAKAMQ